MMIIGIENYFGFLVAGIILNLTPGSDTIYILSRSISQGKRAGIVSAYGIITGVLIHTLLAALGLSVLLAKSAVAFNLVKYIGAGYLVYLGIKTLLSRGLQNGQISDHQISNGTWAIFRQGVLTNLLNPKVALFFLAFFPQFIQPAYTDSVVPFLVLGVTFSATGLIWCLILATAASKFSRYLRSGTAAKWTNRTAGLVFMAMGAKLALVRD